MLLALAPIGCTSQGYQGQSRDQKASFNVRALRTELPYEYAVPTVAAAGEAALRARGYTISGKSVNKDAARLCANAPDDGWLEQTVFESYVTPNGTGISIRVEPMGNESTSRSIMDDVLARLGR